MVEVSRAVPYLLVALLTLTVGGCSSGSKVAQEERAALAPADSGQVATENAAAPASASLQARRPSQSDFKKVVLVKETTRPNVLEIASDGRVFFAEREGAVRVWHPDTGTTTTVAFLPVDAVHTSGLLGMALDPDFDRNGWMYLYYAPHARGKNELARFTVTNEGIDPRSKKVLLEVPVQRNVDGGHSAGEIEFGPHGNLYLSTGDNTNPRATGYAPIDERPGRRIWDAQRASANTMDLRGKILRIRPQADGTYTIPDGNLFPYGVRGRPEIYVMGNRNPYRFKIDPQTGALYWGEVGPDAGAASAERGPMGYDEFNRAQRAGYFGWPYFIGDNKAYHDYDFATETAGPPFVPERPVNDAPRNTGAYVLPPAEPALIWYPYGASEEFPELGTGGRSAMAGPVYRYDAQTAGPNALPPYYDGRLFIFDFMRSWIKAVAFNEAGELKAITPFLPHMTFNRPMDMEVGPKGHLYVIEWGSSYEGWYNDDARIVRLDYDPASRSSTPPVSSAEPAATRRAAGSDVSFTWPEEGGIVDFNAALSYCVAIPDKAAGAEARVTVRSYLVHDTHQHAQAQHLGRSGHLAIREDNSHFYLEEQQARLVVHATGDASGRGVGALARDSVTLQPRRKQAEHTTASRKVEREFAGSTEGGSVLRVRRGVEVFMVARDSSVLAYAPVNLHRIDGITLRMQPVAGGTVEVRLDGPDGELLATAPIEAAANEDPAAWQEVTLPVQDPGGPHTLVLVFRGTGTDPVAKLDWMTFEGAGMMGRECTGEAHLGG